MTHQKFATADSDLHTAFELGVNIHLRLYVSLKGCM